MRLNIVNAFSEEDEELTLVTPPAVDETATTPEASEEPPMLADDAEMKPKRKGRPTRIGEISALAEKNRHVYRMSDGTLEAVYTAPPAEYDPDEVDDEPIPEEDGKHYRQRRPHFTARFSRDEENDELFSVEQGEYRVTVSAKKKKRPHPHGTLPVRHENALVFKGVKDGTDYEYAVRDDGVKENIIVKKPAASYAYAFLLHCKGLRALLSEDATRVSFVDGNETEIFHIPAPFMTDAEGVRSETLSYALEAMDEDTYTLTVTADKEWMNDEARAFPVTIDPQIILSGEGQLTSYGWSSGKIILENLHTIGTLSHIGPITNGDGSSRETAKSIALNTPQSGTVKYSGHEIWYQFYAPANAEYDIYTEGALDTMCELYDASCNLIAACDDDIDNNFRLKMTLTGDALYFLRVSAYAGYTGSYTLTVASNATPAIGRMYLHFNMPRLPHNPRIRKAELLLYQNHSGFDASHSPKIGVYHVTSPITTGTCTPTYDETALDYEVFRTENEQDENGNYIPYRFNITTLIDCLNKEETTSANLMIKLLDESVATTDNVTLFGSNYSAKYAPKLSITYEDNYSFEDQSHAQTHSLGRFGQGSVDLQSGSLKLASEDFAWAGNRMPVTIKHLYTSVLARYAYTKNSILGFDTADFSAMNIGHGFKLNLMQSMVSATFIEKGASVVGYAYADENGNLTYFKEGKQAVYPENGSSCYLLYEDIDGSGMIYDPVARTLKQGEDTYLFDTEGRLVRITDASCNRTNITYTNGRIDTVTDSAGRVFRFGYDEDGQLISITAPDDSTIIYSYAGDYLTGIHYPDGREAVLLYTNAKPLSITLKDADDTPIQKVEYVFEGDRLVRLTESGVDGALASTSSYTYSVTARVATVTTSIPETNDEGETETHTISTVFTFDEEGNVISEYLASQGTGNVGTSESESGVHPYAEDGGAKTFGTSRNLLSDHGFASLSAWTETGNVSTIYCSLKDVRANSSDYGGKKLLITSTVADAGVGGITQTKSSLPAGEYTFSAYVVIPAEFEGNGVKLRVTKENGTFLAESEFLRMRSWEATRLVVPFVLAENGSVTVQILIDGKGSALIDAAQLEKNTYASAYNLLENGDFEEIDRAWLDRQGNAPAYSQSSRFSMSRALCLESDLRAASAKQTLSVRTECGTRETFTLSGWAKGYGFPDHDDEVRNTPVFALCAEIVYADKTKEQFVAPFSPATTVWQYTSIQFSKSRYAAVKELNVYCDYSYNSGTAYFDDVQLVRDGIETNLSSTDFDTQTADTDGDTTTEAERAAEAEEAAMAFKEATDNYGNALTETTIAQGELGTIYRAFGFSDNGNDLLSETDARGNETAYTVNAATSRNEEVTDRCGNKTAYEYDDSGRTTKVTSKNADGAEIAHVSYSYDAFDNMTEIARGDGMKYVLAYNEFHHLASIGIDGKSENLVEYTYKNANGKLKEIRYANGDTMKASYSALGQMVGERWVDKNGDEIARYKYAYDGERNITRSIDFTAEKEYNYEYSEGKLVRATESNITVSDDLVTSKVLVHTVRYHYDSEGNLVKKVATPNGGESFTYYYETVADQPVVKYAFAAPTVSAPTAQQIVSSHSKTDSFGRKVFDELRLGTAFLFRKFDYHEGAVTETHTEKGKVQSTPTTQLVSKITFSDERTIEYEYDAEERITKVTDSVDGETVYTYDALGQLLTETVNGATVNAMEYDNYGNILSKNGVAYTYGDSVWKDLLTKVGNDTISYDAQGNPTTYLGHALTWEKGRQLKSYDSNTYTYNANGIRTSKTVNGVTHTYTLDGTKILRECWNYDATAKTYRDILIPLYDNEDNVCGILYNDTQYYFLKNLQGDVIAIVDKDAQTVARYSYDAWGVPTILSDSTGIIANINPFRYRGYYYDEEVGLYYLQSRYYDANVSRFVHGDDIDCINVCGTSNDNNIFNYCRNAPITTLDQYGYFGTPIQWIFATVGAVAGWFLGDFIAKKLGYYSGWKYWAIRVGVIIGGAVIGWFAAKLLTKILQAFLDSHKAIYNKLPRLAKKFLGLKCFVAGTLVATSNGYQKIEEIKVGDSVLVYDFDTCRITTSTVMETYVNTATELTHVWIDSEEIISTPQHKYYTNNRGWISAVDLKETDELIAEDGSTVCITRLYTEKLDVPVKVYNLNVGKHHNYFVSMRGILVHNLGCEDVATNSLKKISKSQIKQLGGEKVTSAIKKTYGGSKANLYIGSDGSVYVSVNGSKIAQWVGTIETLAEMYL